MIRIITIEREYGSGAAAIAEKVAARLGWKLWDQLLTEEIARLAHCESSVVQKREERRDPLYYRLIKSFALGSYEGSRGAPIEMLDADSIVRISEQVVERVTSAGNCVIVGRGSQHFLRHRKDTFRFFLYASREGKVRRLVSEGKRGSDAATLVDRVDRERAGFIKQYFHVEWPNRAVYHAMFNTDAGEEIVVQAILDFYQQSQSVGIAD
ncbi:MAG: cytidylate kinase-like family protein [Candidatus Sulfotelmatobacter sp.]